MTGQLGSLEWLAEHADESREKVAEMLRIREEVGNDDTIDENDKLIVVCERLDIPVEAPEIETLTDGTRMLAFLCSRCGVAVLDVEVHRLWHRRIQAAVKYASVLADLSGKTFMFLGGILKTLVEETAEEETDDG